MEKDWKAASTTCRSGAGEGGGERVMVAVMLGEEGCLAATCIHGAREMKVMRFVTENIMNVDIERFSKMTLANCVLNQPQ